MLQTRFNFPSVYNPANQTAEEIISNFVIRTQEFQDLFFAIKTDKLDTPPQHFIIQGQRGYGKTTLLLRLKYEILNDEELRKSIIPVLFDEEQYSVRTLEKLWEEVLDVLESENPSFAGITEKIDELYDSDLPEEAIFDLLVKSLTEKNKRIILLLDNFGDMIEKFSKKENQRLREVFTTCEHIKLIGASSRILEFYYDYKQPFFDFFKVVTLDELTQEETITLLLKLGETYKSEEISKIIENQPERIEALRRITGGIPRTVVLLFQIFVDDVNGNSFKDLDYVLDMVTPLYKQRLDNLTSPQQAIIDAVAQNWDAISTKEISKKIRMNSKEVSAQLNLLVKNQLVAKIRTSTKNHLYQISERFFNIYYLMRLGKRKNRNKVLWLIRFLEIMCSRNELISRAQQHISYLREGVLQEKHACYIAKALAKTALPVKLQHELITETRHYLAINKSELLNELEKSHIEILEEVKEDILNDRFETAKRKLKNDGVDEAKVAFFIGQTLQFDKQDYNNALKYYLIAAENGNIESLFHLAYLYQTVFMDFENAKKYYLLLTEKEDADAMFNLALLYKSEYKDFDNAKKYYKMAVEKGNIDAMYNLALLYQTELEEFDNAKKYYMMASALGDAGAMYNLALLYQTEYKDFNKAKRYYLMAVEKGHIDAVYNLALLFQTKFNDFENAKKYYLTAIKMGDITSMHNLAWLFLELRENKGYALSLQRKVFSEKDEPQIIYVLISLLLWNDEVEEAATLFVQYFNNEEEQKEVNHMIQDMLLMFLAKKQYQFVFKLFSENKFNVIDKYKPIYYAVLKLMGSNYSDEFKRMPPELNETVTGIIEQIKQLEEDYR